jgi:hypothetical protein
MTILSERSAPSVVDVLDRVLDKGIVIDASIRVSLVGVEVISIEARAVIASIDTYVTYAMGARPVTKRARSRQRARRPLMTLRCANGCTFRRRVTSLQRPETTACPYRSGAVCRLTAV